jgi:hypothetical protein
MEESIKAELREMKLLDFLTMDRLCKYGSHSAAVRIRNTIKYYVIEGITLDEFLKSYRAVEVSRFPNFGIKSLIQLVWVLEEYGFSLNDPDKCLGKISRR